MLADEGPLVINPDGSNNRAQTRLLSAGRAALRRSPVVGSQPLQILGLAGEGGE